MKCDKESSARQVQNEIMERRKGLVTVPENAPKGDSASNGAIEKVVQEVEGYLRTLKAELESKVGQVIPSTSVIMSWLIRHVGVVITRSKVSERTRMTAYEFHKGKESSAAMLPIGESIMYMPPKSKSDDRSKLEPRFQEGIYLGVSSRSNEVIVGTESGVTVARSIRRRPDEEKIMPNCL